MAGILYITYQGLKCLKLTDSVNILNVKPKEGKLDIAYLLGSLYSSIPELISGKTARDKYKLKNFMPITACYPGDKPAYIFILGRNPAHNEAGRIRAFVKSAIQPGEYLVISRRFYKQFEDQPIRFVPWPLAEEVVPNGLKDNNHYLNDFKNTLQARVHGVIFGKKRGDFHEVMINGKMYNVAEIFYGNTQGVRQALSHPLAPTILYAPSRVHFPGIKLEKGSFLFFSRKDESFYQAYLNDKGRMMSRPYNL
mgnify:FL=1|jgi:hypothetical protein